MSGEEAFEKKKKMRDAKYCHSSVISRNYIVQDMLFNSDL